MGSNCVSFLWKPTGISREESDMYKNLIINNMLEVTVGIMSHCAFLWEVYVTKREFINKNLSS